MSDLGEQKDILGQALHFMDGETEALGVTHPLAGVSQGVAKQGPVSKIFHLSGRRKTEQEQRKGGGGSEPCLCSAGARLRRRWAFPPQGRMLPHLT